MKLAVFGATGGIGKLVVKLALAQGHEVRAFVRNPAKLGLTHPKLTVVAGELTDAEKLAEAVRGTGAVINTLGWVKGTTPDDVTAGVVRILDAMEGAGVRRFVTSSGAATDVEGDKKPFARKVWLALSKTFFGKMVAQKQSEYEAVRQRNLDWSIARPPQLTNAPGKGTWRVSTDAPPGLSVARADVASFLIHLAASGTYVRAAPFVSW